MVVMKYAQTKHIYFCVTFFPFFKQNLARTLPKEKLIIFNKIAILTETKDHVKLHITFNHLCSILSIATVNVVSIILHFRVLLIIELDY